MQGDSIREHLEEKSASIIGKWSQLVLETYPAEDIDGVTGALLDLNDLLNLNLGGLLKT